MEIQDRFRGILAFDVSVAEYSLMIRAAVFVLGIVVTVQTFPTSLVDPPTALFMVWVFVSRFH
jgi:hypothetical protein